MTETDVKLGDLQQQIAHLASVSEEGWLLKWGESPETSFEVVCRGANALQVQKLEAILSEGYQKTLVGQ